MHISFTNQEDSLLPDLYKVFNTRNGNAQDGGIHFSNCISQGNNSLRSYKHQFYKSAQGMALCRVEAAGSEASPVCGKIKLSSLGCF